MSGDGTAALIGRLLMIGFEGGTFTPDLEKLLLEIKPGGMILFKRNVTGGPEKVAALVADCQDLARSQFGRHLLVAIDQEGGPVKRLGPPFAQLPSQRALADQYDLAEVRSLAEQSGRELAAVGINFNLTPVLDVCTDPRATFMAARSFGSDPEKVAVLGQVIMEGHLKYGVQTCGKHFPGIGDVYQDPHLDLPSVSYSAERIRDVALVPFIRNIDAGLPAVMTSHINYPALDAEFPATFSKKIITGMLRDACGFKGLILTDDLEMGAIVKHYRQGPAAVMTTVAGSDLLLVCHREDRIFEARDALVKAMDTGRIPVGRVEESMARQDAVLAGAIDRPTGEPVGE